MSPNHPLRVMPRASIACALCALTSTAFTACVQVTPNTIITLSPNDHARTGAWVDQVERAESCSWSYFYIFRSGDASYDMLFKELTPSRSDRRLSYVLVDTRTTNYFIAARQCVLLTAHYIATGDAAASSVQEGAPPKSPEDEHGVNDRIEDAGSRARDRGEEATGEVVDRVTETEASEQEDEDAAAGASVSARAPRHELQKEGRAEASASVERLEFKTRAEAIESISTLKTWVGSDVFVKPRGKNEVLRGELIRVVKLDAHLVLGDGKKAIVNLTRVDWIERVAP